MSPATTPSGPTEMSSAMSRISHAAQFSPWLCSLLFIAAAHAEPKFPYQAAVIGDNVEVRCGPGTNFYPTSKLKQQDVVVVHRHDHGGWYMIEPPAGSFSWIEAELIEKTQGDRGVVTLNPKSDVVQRPVARIGSTLGEDFAYSGRQLSPGEEVRILGEKKLPGPRGDVRMYKIAPPRQEFRWLRGEFLIPLSAEVQQQLAADPFQVPPEHRERLLAAGRAPLPTNAKTLADEPATPEQLAAANEFHRLDQLDRHYAEMMNHPPTDWRLDELEQQYRSLQSAATSKVGGLIDQRLEILEKRRAIASHYRTFAAVTAETDRREAALQSGQSQQFASLPTGAMMASSGGMMAPPPTGVTPQLNGAGILQPTGGGLGRPAFALMTPEGRLLAYVEPGAGVSLLDWVGRPVGVVGQRGFEPALGADKIVVHRVSSVQLTQ